MLGNRRPKGASSACVDAPERSVDPQPWLRLTGWSRMVGVVIEERGTVQTVLMEMPDVVERRVATYLTDVDAAVPGLVQAAYVTGSVALGDFQAEISDIDVVAVCSDRPDDLQLEALAALHRPCRPHVDVLYVTGNDLRGDPGRLSAPHSREGTFHRDGSFAANPVAAEEPLALIRSAAHVAPQASGPRGGSQGHGSITILASLTAAAGSMSRDRYGSISSASSTSGSPAAPLIRSIRL